MTDSSNAKTDTSFTCECEEWARSACVGEPFYAKYQRRQYCVLHFPREEKLTNFKEALTRKQTKGDFDFSGVWFPEKAPFRDAHFINDVSFYGATFNGIADFGGAVFDSEVNFATVVFKQKAYFRGAVFGADARFISVTFGETADFYHATFREGAYFRFSTFNGHVGLRLATFDGKSDFSYARFNAEVKFAGFVRGAPDGRNQVFSSQSSVDFHGARTDKPEDFSFDTLTLFPNWFVDFEVSRINFTNVKWSGSLAQEIRNIANKGNSSPYALLGTTCWQLATNAEENHRYGEASRFRYMAMDSRRLEGLRGTTLGKLYLKASGKVLIRLYQSLQRDWGVHRRTLNRAQRNVKLFVKNCNILHWSYWIASGYGERVVRAFLMLLAIWVFFAILYTQVGFLKPEQKLAGESVQSQPGQPRAPLILTHALAYSLGVMTLQKPEPRPATATAQSLIFLESVIGPVQAALFGLAIRRKFMR